MGNIILTLRTGYDNKRRFCRNELLKISAYHPRNFNIFLLLYNEASYRLKCFEENIHKVSHFHIHSTTSYIIFFRKEGSLVKFSQLALRLRLPFVTNAAVFLFKLKQSWCLLNWKAKAIIHR